MSLAAYVREVFDGSSCASFARWATAATVATGCWALVYLVRSNGALPGAVDLGALAVWMTAPYGINKVAAALGSHAGDSARMGEALAKPAAGNCSPSS